MTSYRTDTGGLGNISRESSMILSGNHFFMTFKLTGTEEWGYAIIPPALSTGLVSVFSFKILASGGISAKLYDNFTISEPLEGIPEFACNNNRLSTNSAQTRIYEIIGTSSGSPLWQGSAGDIVGDSISNCVLDFNCGEIILDGTKQYALHIDRENTVIANVAYSVFFKFYEI